MTIRAAPEERRGKDRWRWHDWLTVAVMVGFVMYVGGHVVAWMMRG